MTDTSPKAPGTEYVDEWCNHIESILRREGDGFRCLRVPNLYRSGYFGDDQSPDGNRLIDFLGANLESPQLSTSLGSISRTFTAKGTADFGVKFPEILGSVLGTNALPFVPNASTQGSGFALDKVTIEVADAQIVRIDSPALKIDDATRCQRDLCRRRKAVLAYLCQDAYKLTDLVLIGKPKVKLEGQGQLKGSIRLGWKTAGLDAQGNFDNASGATFESETPVAFAIRRRAIAKELQNFGACDGHDPCIPSPAAPPPVIPTEEAGGVRLDNSGRAIVVSVTAKNTSGKAEFALFYRRDSDAKVLDLMSGDSSVTLYGGGRLYVCSREPGTGGGCSSNASVAPGSATISTGAASVQLAFAAVADPAPKCSDR